MILFSTVVFSLEPLHAMSQEGEKLIEESENAITSRKFDLLKQKGESLHRLGTFNSDPEEAAVGDALKLYAMISLRDTTDFSAQIENLSRISDEIKDKNSKSYLIITRTLSSYYQHIVNDFSQALHYAMETLSVARKNGDKEAEALALTRISSIYFQKKDASGLSYALDSYELSKKLDNLTVKYFAAINLANYLFNNDKIEEALKYLIEAQGYAKDKLLESEESYIYTFFGDIYDQMGNSKEAEKFYLFGIQDSSSSVFDKIYSEMRYTIFLCKENRLQDALQRLNHSKKVAEENKVTIFDKDIYELYSSIYEASGDYKNSLEAYKKYNELSFQIFSEQKEREFAILDLRSRVAEEEYKNAQQSLQLVKRTRAVIIVSSVAALLIIICGALLIYYRLKMKGYKQTVERYMNNFRQERNLRQQLEKANSDLLEARKTGSLKEEKSDELFKKVQELMTEEKVYRDYTITLDKLANILGTNRTYLSQVVNEKSGKSFSSYINDFRLDEAVELLSDTTNTEPLKSIGISVGFASPSNFYTLFKQRVGVSPSVFRSNMS